MPSRNLAVLGVGFVMYSSNRAVKGVEMVISNSNRAIQGFEISSCKMAVQGVGMMMTRLV